MAVAVSVPLETALVVRTTENWSDGLKDAVDKTSTVIDLRAMLGIFRKAVWTFAQKPALLGVVDPSGTVMEEVVQVFPYGSA